MAWNPQVGEKSLGNEQPGVVTGLVVRDPGSATLTTTIEGGWIKLAIDPTSAANLGKITAEWRIADTSKAFTASKDTYVYVSSAGALGYIEVANGAAKPSQATLTTTGGYGAQFIAKVVTDGTRVTAGGVTDLRQNTAGADMQSDSILGSFAAATSTTYWKAPARVRIWSAQATVQVALANTDAGTFTFATGVNDVYTNQTNGVITLALSSAIGTRAACFPSDSYIIDAGQTLRISAAKTTVGGQATVQILFSRV